MDLSNVQAQAGQAMAAAEQRTAPRYTSLIRSAKLVSPQGEFVCVIRDVSATGVSLRAFHALPRCDNVALELQNGELYEIRPVRSVGSEASFTFQRPVEVDRLIRENWTFPKRPLRLNISIPLVISTLSHRGRAIAENMSQQGARLDCDALLAIDQPVYIEAEQVPRIRAKVRWRRDGRYGVVFDNTFSLRDFALLAASVQCPALLDQ